MSDYSYLVQPESCLQAMAAQVEAISADLQSEIEEAQNASAVLIQSKKTTRTFDSGGTVLNETLEARDGVGASSVLDAKLITTLEYNESGLDLPADQRRVLWKCRLRGPCEQYLTRHTYDTLGQLTSTTSGGHRGGAYTTPRTTAFYDYDLAFGVATRMVAPGGLSSGVGLDGFGRTTSTSDVLHNETYVAFLAPGAEYPDEVAVVQKQWSPAQDTETYQGLDRLGRPVVAKAKMATSATESGWTWTATGYNARGLTEWVSSRPQAKQQALSPSGRSTTEYDAANRVIREQRPVYLDAAPQSPRFAVVQYIYDEGTTTHINEDGLEASRTFDGAERAISTTDRHGSMMYKTYGPFGALARMSTQRVMSCG